MENNAIIRRLKTINIQWSTFRTIPNARFCRWHIKQDEGSMMDTFFQSNAHEDSDTPDIFIRLEAPFTNASDYGKTLSEELTQLIEDDRIALAEDGIDIDWQPQHVEEAKNTAVGFLRNFSRFADSLGLDSDEDLVVAFLSPTDIKSPAQWTKWWADATALNLPKHIRLMVCDTEGCETLQNIAQQQKEKMQTIRPDLKMNDAIRELMTEFGDQEDNCTHFRKAFFELTQTIPTKNVLAIGEAAKKALALARLIDFPHLEVAVLCTAATGFSMAGELQAAVQTFDKAARIAKDAEDKPLVKEFPDMKVDLPGGNLFQQLGVQVLFFKASAYISAPTPQYEMAFGVYQQAEKLLTQMMSEKTATAEEVDWTNGGIIHFHRLEAIRMMGYCSEKMGRNQQALTIYAKAVTIAEKMSAEIRQSTMLPYVGQAMLGICQKQGMKQEYWTISEKMTVLLGKDWQSVLPKAA